MNINTILQKKLEKNSKTTSKSEWMSSNLRIKRNEQELFNLQLERLQYITLNQLAKEIIDGKLENFRRWGNWIYESLSTMCDGYID